MEVQQGFATDLYGLVRLYPTIEEGAEQLIKEVIATARIPLLKQPKASTHLKV